MPSILNSIIPELGYVALFSWPFAYNIPFPQKNHESDISQI